MLTGNQIMVLTNDDDRASDDGANCNVSGNCRWQQMMLMAADGGGAR